MSPTAATTALSSRVRRLRDARLVPYAAAVLLGPLGLVEYWSDPSFRPPLVVAVVSSAWIASALLTAGRWPALGAALVAGFYPVSMLLGAPGPGGTGLIAVLVAVAWAGYAASPRSSRTAMLASIALFIATDAVRRGLSWDTVFFPAIFAPAWWTGTLVRREQERSRQLAEMAAELEAQREATAHAAVVEERARIAREVHDSVAHSVSVMTLQIGGLRRQLAGLLDERPDEREVMLGLERLGRQSVEELRAAVGILRDADTDRSGELSPDGPASLSQVARLVDDVRRTGVDVGLEVSGHLGELPRGLDLAAYRVVQESLTNVLRHAPSARADVRVSRDESRLRVSVVDDGRGSGRSGVTDRESTAAPAIGGGGNGHGLRGLRERAQMFDATFDAGPVPGGGFEVHADFPLDRRWA